MSSISPVNLVLNGLATEIQMSTLGAFAGTAPPSLTADSYATVSVTLDNMKSTFTFHSDSTDFTDVDAEDVIYYCDWQGADINVSNSAVDATFRIDENAVSNDIKHDFIRHIANYLFNTHRGVDLFDNEADMLLNLEEKGEAAWSNNQDTGIKNKINAANNKTNGDTSDDNYCRVLFRQLVNLQPNRFQTLDAVSEENGNYKLPFVSGDSISFKVTYKAHADQHLIVGRDDAVPDRSYAIKLVMA